MPRSSANSSCSSRPLERILDRYHTQSRLWSGETRVTSARSTTPLMRTSPAASVAIRDVDVSPIRAAAR